MALLLLLVIYIAFIGLGIPDSLIGNAWPAIYKDFNVPISYASFVTMTVTFGTILSSMFSARLINKFGTRNIVIISTCLTVIGLLGYHFSSNIIFMILSSVPLGIGAGAIDAALNNYVAINYKPMHMNFLHCFYGIGVSLSPYIMAFALAQDENWRLGYLIAFCIQSGIALILLASFPLWKKVKNRTNENEIKPVTVPFKKMATTPYIVFIVLIFFFYCGLESTSGVWSASFLVNEKQISSSDAAKIAGLFYVGLAVGRFLAGLISNKLSKFKLIFIGEGIIITAIILLFIPSGNLIFSSIALLLIGLGCGPIYPQMSAMTPSHYGEEYSQSIMGFQMSLAYVAVISISPLFGLLGQLLGFYLFPIYLSILMGLLLLFTLLMYVNRNTHKPLYIDQR